MLKINSYLDISEKFSFCFSCQIKDQGYFYYSRMWKVEVYESSLPHGSAEIITYIGNVCDQCVNALKKHSLIVVPSHIPEVQFEQFIKTFIFKKGYKRDLTKYFGKGEEDARKAGVILSRV